jgi:hypothetical protein
MTSQAAAQPPIDPAFKRPHRLVSRQTALDIVHGSSAIGRMNKWLAVKITNFVGSMTCAYLFAALALVSLPSAITSGSAVTIVSWISQTFLQLVLLSIIIVGQNVQAAHSDQRAEADHETLDLLHQINLTQLQILEELRAAEQAKP